MSAESNTEHTGGHPDSQSPISHTARIVAAKRAIEQERPDRLFEDPFAADLAGEEVETLLERWRSTGKDINRLRQVRTRYVAIRTRIFDDFLLACNEQIQQVVILGAGLDARAFRLNWQLDTWVYEVDRSEVLQEKMMILQDVQPRCHHQMIECDLTQAWHTFLLTSGFDPNQPTIWLLEGVLMYLQESDVHQVLQTLSSLSATNSALGCDLVSVGSIETGLQSRGRVRRYWQFGTDDPAGLLAQYGWQASMQEPGDAGASFGRYTKSSQPVDTQGRRIVLVTARKG